MTQHLHAERWKRVGEILAQALALAEDERPAFLSVACAGDDDLRREVETLLLIPSARLERLERPLFDSHPEPAGAWTGRRVGHYLLEEPLGRGGMGVVYAARRVDDAYRGRVAIKVLRQGLDDDDLVQRFRAERRILAGLEHPNIARFLDAGATEEQRPYFVLELVEGEPIDRFCDRRDLSLAERLRLFLKVCDAVQAAHRSLIVHRDLKPGNILVTAEGEPKLLDFGIAKVLEDDPERAPGTTSVDQRPMTPEYASPEQVRGEPITTATDVYSLGVLLYRLATGTAPYELPVGSLDALRRVICEVEPPRPSARVARGDGRARDVRRLRRQLADDLDNVILKALEKDPRRRYRSADALADDIRRQLAGEAVAARPATWTYRAGKFVRRRARVLALAMLGALLLGGALADRVARQRVITRERDRARRVSSFLVELFEVSDPRQSRGRNVLAREVLDRGVQRVEEDLRSEPEVQAALLHTLGSVYRRLGLFAESEPLLRKALASRQATLGAHDPEVAATLDELANLLHDRGDFAGAEALYREALAIRGRERGHDPGAHAETLINLAVLQHERGQTAEEEALYREALELLRASPQGHDLAFVVCAHNLALMAHARGDLEPAERSYREALARMRRLRGDEHPDVAQILNNLAGAREGLGDLAGAEELTRRALAMRRRLLPAGHAHIGESAHNLARQLGLRGRLEEAEPLAREALAIVRHDSQGKGVRTAAYQANLGFLLTERGRLDEAESALRDALALAREAVGETHVEVAKIAAALGTVARLRGDAQTARSWSAMAVDVSTRALGEPHVTTAACRLELARALLAGERSAEAEPLARRSLAVFEARLPADHWRTAEARSVVAACLLRTARAAEATPALAASCPALAAQRGAESTAARAACAWLREARSGRSAG